jgi:hypothetical protein
MSSITYANLKTNIDCIQQIRNVRIVQRMNEHGRLSLTGILKEGMKDDYIKKNLAKEQIILSSSGDQPKTLFQGMVKEVSTEAKGGVYFISISALSNSCQMDQKKASHSFQDKKMTYATMMKDIIKKYPGGDLMDLATKGKAIGQLIVQYEETDWEFLKRLASHFHTGILPSLSLDGPKITIGIPKGTQGGKEACVSYEIVKQLEQHLKLIKNGANGLSEADSMKYRMETDADYEIGDQINCQNTLLYVNSKEAFLSGGIIKFRYFLSSMAGFYENTIYNHSITGTSLKGKVLDTIKDKLKVQLEIDSSQNRSKAWKFSYATPYSAEGHSGFYCMPERGDTVLIYFPTQKESDAFGMNSIRKTNKDSDHFDDPDVKIFRTKNGKEIRFSPEEILITCSNGVDEITGEDQNIYIKLHQDKGIEIISSGPIKFKSNKKIRLEAEDAIELSASNEIRLTCKTSEILIDDKIDICGEDVKIN